MIQDVLRQGRPRDPSSSGRSRAWFLAVALGGMVGFGVLGVRGADAGSGTDLRLDELRRLVSEKNESVQMRMLESEVSERAYQAERGIFEPQVVGSVERTDTDRPNNTQQRAGLGFFGPSTPVFLEQNWLYNAGIEFLTPLGTRLRAGFTLRQLENNLQYSGTDTNRTFYGPEFETFVGLTAVQPLLKNFGVGPTMAKIRLAALASDAAYHEYRRQLMLTMAQAEAAYWDLYLAQEKTRISTESLAIGEKVLTDNKARLEVGKAPEIEVLQAEAGVSLRRARLNEQQQRALEVAARLSNLYARTPRKDDALPRAIDTPSLVEDDRAHSEDLQLAFEGNPDYRIRQTQLAQEKIRVGYTRNQRLPQLDLRGSYGLNGLGLSAGDSWSAIDSQDYPAWSLGVELRIPFTGGVKERNDYRAAVAGRERAQLGLQEIETQILNGLDSARRRLRLYSDDVTNYRSVAGFHERLLQSQLDRLSVGGISSALVLETEEKLSEARSAVVEGLVLYRRSLLELELVRGSLLKARGLDVTRDDLRSITRQHLDLARVPPQYIRELERRAATEFESLLHQPNP